MTNRFEVVDGLILGGVRDIAEIIKLHPDTLVVLDWLPDAFWGMHYEGEVLNRHIRDFDVLEYDQLKKLIDEIYSRLSQGKRVAIFCHGGCGRTGYVAACVLCRMGISDPITFLRTRYRPGAVETTLQAKEVRRYCEEFGIKES